MENSRRCEKCNVDIHRASYAKHVRSKKPLENTTHDEIIIPEWLIEEEQAPIKNKIKKVCNRKTMKELARENIKVNDKILERKLAKKVINLYYFTDESLKIRFKINLESRNVNYPNSILTNTPIYPDSGIKARYINKILKEEATIYLRLINQYTFKYHNLFSISFFRLMKKTKEVMKLKCLLI